jgi:hypothetical protein
MLKGWKLIMFTIQKCLIHSLIGAALVWVSGCKTLDKVKYIFAKPVILACPDTRILADASEIIRYVDGGGRDLTDVVSEGKIQNISLACLTKVNRENFVGVMEVEVGLNIDASRGPADRSRKATYPYFISVTDLNKKIVYHEKLNVDINFSGNRSKLSFTSVPVTIVLPLRPKLTGKNYLIYSGFILTREQLKHNRLRRKQKRY